MGFVTGMPRMAHTGINGTWEILDNQLYFDNKTKDLYIVPRKFYTDNYTVPNWITWLAGAGDDYDVRPSHFHDFGCWLHALARITVSVEELRTRGIVREHLCKDGKFRTICEDVPIEFIKIEKKGKFDVDNLFKRAMDSTGRISERSANILRAGVFFNIGWLLTNNSVDLEKFYTGINLKYLKNKE